LSGYTTLDVLLQEELQQRYEEGYDTCGYAEKLEEAGQDHKRLMQVYEEMNLMTRRPNFTFEEPSELAEIREMRAQESIVQPAQLQASELRDRLYGAWLGRCIGCSLGKPLEGGIFSIGSNGEPGWKVIQRWYEGAGAWPIDFYVPQTSSFDPLMKIDSLSCRETITCMEPDDDIRYTLLGLKLLEERGLDWDSWHVGNLWHRMLAYQHVCTAETQAYKNFIEVSPRLPAHKPFDWDNKKDWVRTYLNPYREFIGAQIRVDAYGYAAAGNPQLAAELAWRDASFSHVKNGIYGAMFVSAMIAAAFTESDMETIVEIGLNEIPKNCRLAHDIRTAVGIAQQADSQLKLLAEIELAFRHYNWVHTNNNAALVAAALVYSKGDFEKAVTTAVAGGWDTDCNGATVGSIVGAMLGREGLPNKWIAPLNDTIYGEVIDFHPIKIAECTDRTFAVHQRIMNLGNEG